MERGEEGGDVSRVVSVGERLALSRTGLANERTLLAYVRTSLAIVAIGGSIIKFFSGVWMTEIGIVVILLGAGVGVFGAERYRRMRREIRARMGE
tara:strand:- start:191 stop:475 length:285 start_codon:yes stop_codon:yes gene_type:complete